MFIVISKVKMDEKIIKLVDEIQILTDELNKKQKELLKIREGYTKTEPTSVYSPHFSKLEIQKYCRQIIVPQIGIEGQARIKTSKVFVVGVGGLGCPALQYLASAGIGTLGFIDNDIVSTSNLHRQILFGEEDVGREKVKTAVKKLLKFNSLLKVVPIKDKLTRSNCVKIFSEFDLILDCTDNVPTRYLVNDVCVLLKKPLIAANAIKFEGQLLKIIPGETACYRCLFPTPPDPACVGACNEDGVIGAGVMGTLQALEAIKHITCSKSEAESQKLTVFDADSLRFRHLNMRPKNSNCLVCSPTSTITLENLPDYEKFCGMAAQEETNNYPPKIIIPDSHRAAATKLFELTATKQPYLILDVRPKVEYEMCRLPNSMNVPLRHLCANHDQVIQELKTKVLDVKQPIFVTCRCGNDSQLAVKLLRDNYCQDFDFFDLAGGLYSWKYEIDPEFPIY